jgi:DNA primase
MAVKLSQQQIENWVARNFPSYKRKSHGRQLVINSPFTLDTGFHFWIATEQTWTKEREGRKPRLGYWVHDFRPGQGKHNTSFIKFVMEIRGLSYHAAVQEVVGGTKQSVREMIRSSLKQRETEEDDPEPDTEEPEKEIELPSGSRPFTDNTIPQARQISLNYLASRKVSEETATRLHLHYTMGEIVFPYIEYGSIVFWQTREILNKRFLFPDETKTGLMKTDYLYNFDNVEPSDYAAVVESIFNCISLGDGCLASGGAVIAGKQVQKLKALNPQTLVLAPDNDKAGYQSLSDNYFLLKKNFNLAYCLPPDGIKDWNDLEKRDGVGSARRYFDGHIHFLTMSVLNKLMSKVA